MFLRIKFIAVIVLIVLFASTPFTSAGIFSSSSSSECRLVAIGDIHGDFSQLFKALTMTKLLSGTADDPASTHWIGGCATLVFTGDHVDRGPEALRVLDFVHGALPAMAKRAGGRVVQLLGNHEQMMLAGDHRYVHGAEFDSKGGADAWRNIFSHRHLTGQRVMQRRIAFQENSTRSVFVHAGITPEWAQLGVARLNSLAFRQMVLLNKFQGGVFANDGPVWDRSLLGEAQSGDCARLEKSLAFLHADRMIVGHTPQAGGKIGSFCDGRMLAIDVGISKSMMGNMAALEIVLDEQTKKVTLYAWYPDSGRVAI